MILCQRATLLAAVFVCTLSSADAQQIVLRLHQPLPAAAPIPKNFLAPWAQKVEAESGGKIKVELYPSMQLGGTPPQLYDQAKDGVVDLIWSVAGYTPGRFPKAEAFELPFIAGNGEQNSQAAWEFYEKNLKDTFADVKVIAVHTHGPGLIHAKSNGIRKLEDMKTLKLRGPSRMTTKLLEVLGATPVGMPVPAVPDSLSKGVIDGALLPWEITTPLKIAELVNTHTEFSGNRSLYVAFFFFVMNKAKYESLPAELKAVIDRNSGIAISRMAGKVMDDGDAPGLAAAKARGNAIVKLDVQETARWKAVAKPVIDGWIVEMDGKGLNGKQLVDDTRAMIAKYAGPEQ